MLVKFQIWYLAGVPLILVGYDDNGDIVSIPYDVTDEDMTWEDLEDSKEKKDTWIYSKLAIKPFGDNDAVHYFEAGIAQL